MSILYYYHLHPSRELKKDVEISSPTPIPYDYDHSGFFSDRLYHSRNSHARLYVVTFGYEKSWDMPIYERVINRYTIHFIFDGEGSINGQKVKRGDIYIVRPNEPYVVDHGQKKHLRLGWIALSGTEIELMLDILHLPQEPLYFTDEEQISCIEDLFLDTVYEDHSKEEMQFFLFGRFFEVISKARLPYHAKSLTNNRYIDLAVGFINMHYSSDISVDSIADELHISVSHLRSLFNTHLGYSPQQALIDKRMSVAKALLESEYSISIQTLSNACGYSDQGAFSKRFHKEVGMSPTEYRESYLKRQEKNG